MSEINNHELLRIITDQNNNLAEMCMDLLERVKPLKQISPHPGSSASTNELDEAMAIAQGKIQGAHKDSDNPFHRSKYADLNSCWDACREPLSTGGLSVRQFVEPHPDPYVIRLVTKLCHKSGQWESGVMEFRCQTRLKKEDDSKEGGKWVDANDPQTYGLVLTYARRYGLCAMVGIAPQDTDAEPVTTHSGQKYDQKPFRKATTTNDDSKPVDKPKAPPLPTPPSSDGAEGGQQAGCLSPTNVKKIRSSMDKNNITDEEKADILSVYNIDKIEDIPSTQFINVTRSIAEVVKMREDG
jgi:hypothetical protein